MHTYIHLHLALLKTFAPELKWDSCPLHCSTEDIFLESDKSIESIN